MKPRYDSIEKQYERDTERMSKNLKAKKIIRKQIRPHIKHLKKASYSIYAGHPVNIYIYPEIDLFEKTENKQQKEFFDTATELTKNFNGEMKQEFDETYECFKYIVTIKDFSEEIPKIVFEFKGIDLGTCEVETYLETITKCRIKEGSC